MSNANDVCLGCEGPATESASAIVGGARITVRSCSAHRKYLAAWLREEGYEGRCDAEAAGRLGD